MIAVFSDQDMSEQGRGSSWAIFGAQSLRPKIPSPEDGFRAAKGLFSGPETGDFGKAKARFRVAIIAASTRALRNFPHLRVPASRSTDRLACFTLRPWHGAYGAKQGIRAENRECLACRQIA